MNESYFRVIDTATREQVGQWATPRLISEGHGDAYVPEGSTFWRLRDDGYDPEGTVYTNVRVIPLEDWTVDVHVVIPDPEDPAEYDDKFTVVASDYDDATALGLKAANEDIDQRWGTPLDSGVTVTRVRQGWHR